MFSLLPGLGHEAGDRLLHLLVNLALLTIDYYSKKFSVVKYQFLGKIGQDQVAYDYGGDNADDNSTDLLRKVFI
jgi:hypothetical protein